MSNIGSYEKRVKDLSWSIARTELSWAKCRRCREECMLNPEEQ